MDQKTTLDSDWSIWFLNQRNSDWLTIYTDIQIFTIDKNFNHNIKKLWKLPVEIFALKRSKGVKGVIGIWKTGHLNYLKELFNWTSWCNYVGRYQMKRRYHHRHLRKLPFVGLRILRLDLLLSRTLWLCSSHFHSYHMDI